MQLGLDPTTGPGGPLGHRQGARWKIRTGGNGGGLGKEGGVEKTKTKKGGGGRIVRLGMPETEKYHQ